MALDLNELQNIIDEAKTAEAVKADLSNALHNHNTALQSLNKEIVRFQAQVQEILAPGYKPTGEAAVKARKLRSKSAPKALGEVDPEAPYGRTKDGVVKKKPGRSK